MSVTVSDFNVNDTLAFLARNARGAGKAVLGHAAKLWLVIQAPGTPAKVKAPVIAALIYLGCPLDAVPDFLPMVGWGDDLSALAGAIALAHAFITPAISAEAEAFTERLLG